MTVSAEPNVARYHRQALLPQIGEAGQAKLARSRVLLVGCGALGSHVADQLVRAGVGFLRIVDRDIVELTNLQRQVLYDEEDVRRAWPKALAAAERLAKVNSAVVVEPHVVDFNASNAESLTVDGERPVDLILDGTDNVATRYLVNDVAVKRGIPWIHAACVGTEGRVMAIEPGRTPCLRCVFPEPPSAEHLPTCDTAGVLGAAAAVAASLQVAAATRWLVTGESVAGLRTFNVWTGAFRGLGLADARRPNCPCCGRGSYEFLARPTTGGSVSLCGRDAVQVTGTRTVELKSLARGWRRVGVVEENRYFARCRLTEPAGVTLTAFADGRVIVQGTRDPNRARALYSRFVGE